MIKRFSKNVIFFIILILLTLFFLFRNKDISEVISMTIHVSPIFIAFGLLSMFIFILGEAVNIYMLLKAFGYKKSIWTTLKYSFVGFFYSSITPSASGGQPMQVYHMTKDDIYVSHATILLLIVLSSFQIITLSYLLVSVMVNYNYLVHTLQHFGIIALIGITINIVVLTIILLLIFSKKAANLFQRIVFFFIDKFKIKNPDSVKETISKEIVKYEESANYLKKNTMLFIKILLVTFVQITASYMITYITYRAFNLSDASVFKIITLQAALFSSISAIPLPGSIGINEGGFKIIFGPIFGKVLIDSAVLLNRFMSFYFYVLIGGIISVIAYLSANKMEKIDKVKDHK